LLINKNTEFPKAAWQLVEFLSTAEATKNMALNFANGPVRASVYEDPEYLEMFGVARGWLQGLKASEPLMPGGHEKISEMMDIIGREVSNALLGNKTPKAALQEAQVKVQAIY
jgi:multiple sugar transport system substrate-binding protein